MKIETNATSHSVQPETSRQFLDVMRAKKRSAEVLPAPKQTQHDTGVGNLPAPEAGAKAPLAAKEAADSNPTTGIAPGAPTQAASQTSTMTATQGAPGDQGPPRPESPPAEVNLGVELKISTDQDTGQMQVAVLERPSGKLVRKIPSDELLKLAERMRELNVKARERLEPTAEAGPADASESTGASGAPAGQGPSGGQGANPYAAKQTRDSAPPRLDASF